MFAGDLFHPVGGLASSCSWMVMWVLAVVDIAPCQCFSAIVASMTGAGRSISRHGVSAPSPWTHDNAQLALLVDPDARSRPVSDGASGDERRLGPRSFGVTLSYLAPVRTLNIGKWSTSVGRFHWMRGPCSRHSAIGKSKDFLRLFYPPRRRWKPSEIISSGKQRGKSDHIKTG